MYGSLKVNDSIQGKIYDNLTPRDYFRNVSKHALCYPRDSSQGHVTAISRTQGQEAGWQVHIIRVIVESGIHGQDWGITKRSDRLTLTGSCILKL